MTAYLRHHRDSLRDSLRELIRAPGSHLMSIAVIAITLFLPAALYLAVHSAQQLSGGWDRGNAVTAFLKEGIDDAQAQRLAHKWERTAGAKSARYISPAEGLAEFKRYAGGAIDALEKNPLPGAIVLTPSEGTAAAAQRLAALVRTDPAVEIVQLDDAWLERLHALLELGKRGVLLLTGIIALGVLLIVGNTIRLMVAQRHAEIEVVKLVGGTDAFIRRPFLYLGAMHGLLGAAVAVMGLTGAGALLHEPLATLSRSYGIPLGDDADFVRTFATLLLLGALLGWLGARLAVARSIRNIEFSMT